MPATVVLGAQWGDEGKGKMVDQLASEASWVARFQGGNNAGHTIVIGDRTLKLNHLPSGITYPDCQLVLLLHLWVLIFLLMSPYFLQLDLCKTDHH